MTTDLNFNKILNKLKDIHKDYPDLRFGHVVQAAIDKAKGKPNIDLHDFSSKNILACLEEFHRHNKQSRELAKIRRGEKINIPTNPVPDESEEEKIKKYRKKLIDIKGIGEKVADDILNVFNDERDLRLAILEKRHLPFSEHIVKKLKEVFK